ncbi:MAG TPA: hypothetical protein VL576_00795 [Candidatus Paceibacterota bacterium]|nr:hypothetical protein [Candidatus Paceibacterota bacterium]
MTTQNFEVHLKDPLFDRILKKGFIPSGLTLESSYEQYVEKAKEFLQTMTEEEKKMVPPVQGHWDTCTLEFSIPDGSETRLFELGFRNFFMALMNTITGYKFDPNPPGPERKPGLLGRNLLASLHENENRFPKRYW